VRGGCVQVSPATVAAVSRDTSRSLATTTARFFRDTYRGFSRSSRWCLATRRGVSQQQQRVSFATHRGFSRPSRYLATHRVSRDRRGVSRRPPRSDLPMLRRTHARRGAPRRRASKGSARSEGRAISGTRSRSTTSRTTRTSRSPSGSAAAAPAPRGPTPRPRATPRRRRRRRARPPPARGRRPAPRPRPQKRRGPTPRRPSRT